MIDKTSAKLLNYMISHHDTTSYVWHYGEQFNTMASELQLLPGDLRSCVQHLEATGYIAYHKRNLHGQSISNGFCLTHKGLHRREFSWLEIRQFLFRSILTPIVVSILTTIALHWLAQLL